MLVRFSRQWMFIILLMTVIPVKAVDLDDADERLFRVQLTMAQKGDVRAQYYLGEMHEQGLGTKQNVAEAFKWYAKAAEK
jgi:TPR repeat protein